MWKGAVALAIALIVVAPFLMGINEVSKTKYYIAKTSYRFANPEDRQIMYLSATELDKTVNFYAKILIIIAAIVILLLSLVEYIKFYKIYKEEIRSE